MRSLVEVTGHKSMDMHSLAMTLTLILTDMACHSRTTGLLRSWIVTRELLGRVSGSPYLEHHVTNATTGGHRERDALRERADNAV